MDIRTYPIPDVGELTACLIIWTLSVKTEDNSLHDLMNKGSGATDTGGFVSLPTVANKARALLLFWSQRRRTALHFSVKNHKCKVSLYRCHNALEIYFSSYAFKHSLLLLFLPAWHFSMVSFSYQRLFSAVYCIFNWLNICVYRDSHLKENTGMIRKKNICHYNYIVSSSAKSSKYSLHCI